MEFLNTSLYSTKKAQNHLLTKLTLIMSFISQFLIFIPTVQISVHSKINNFILSYFNILTSKKFNLTINKTSATFSFCNLTKTCFFLTLIFIILATVLTYFKKFNIAAIFFFLACCFPLNFLPTINELKNTFLNLNVSSNKIYIEILWPFFLLILLCFVCCTLSLASVGTEHLAKTIFFCLACTTLFCLIFLSIYLCFESSPAIQKLGFLNMLTASKWNPNFGQFGILNMIKASIFSTLGALLLSAPLGIFTAVFMAEICPKKILKILSPLVDLMAGIPSVVFGFFGMTIIIPAIKKIFYNCQTRAGNPIVGDSMLAVILILTLMILPTIVSTSINALQTVPRQFKEASFGLGANRTETIFKVCLPAAKATIASGLILAIGKAIGETMAVIMVAGNVANPPELLGTVRLLTTGIAININYASGLLKSVLFFMGLVLLMFITAINILFNLTQKKMKKAVK